MRTSNSASVAHALLDGLQNNDTLAAAPTRGGLIVGNATPKWAELALGANKTFLRSNGTDALWSAIQNGDLPALTQANLPAGVKVLFVESVVAGAHTITTAPTTVKSVHITTNTFMEIQAYFEGIITFTATSLKQQIILQVNKASGGSALNASQSDQIVEQQAANVAQVIPFCITSNGVDLAPSGDNITLSENSAAADANTTVQVNYAEITGVI